MHGGIPGCNWPSLNRNVGCAAASPKSLYGEPEKKGRRGAAVSVRVRRSVGFLPMPVRVFFRAMVAAPDLLEIHCGLGKFHFQGLEILHEDL
jgi:hypothetical protein